MTERPLRIVQISDIHLFLDKKKSLLGVNTLESFSEIIQLLKKDPSPPDAILLTGDLSQDRTEDSYRYVADAFKSLPTPIYFIAGNHDDADLMNRVYPYHTISDLKNIILKEWNIILLNSQKPGAVEGYLDCAELDFLKQCLIRYPKHHAIIAFHHQPISVGSQWLDNLGLTNAEEFWDVIGAFSQVRAVLFGHVHQQLEGERNGIPYYSVPSTCIQFKKNSDEFALDNIEPGYRWLDLYSDGELKTAIERLDHYVGVFDKDATGY